MDDDAELEANRAALNVCAQTLMAILDHTKENGAPPEAQELSDLCENAISHATYYIGVAVLSKEHWH